MSCSNILRPSKKFNLHIIAIILLFFIIIIGSSNFSFIIPSQINSINDSIIQTDSTNIPIAQPTSMTRGNNRGAPLFGFNSNATGLPSSGDYNAIAVGKINGDNYLDIVIGGEDYGTASTTGLYGYLNNGDGSWSSTSTITTSDSWGGLELADVDKDGNIELYASNEGWGSDNGAIQGVGAWEYSGSSWSTSGISSPYPSGYVNDIKVLNFTQGPGLDMAIATSVGDSSGVKVNYSNGQSPVSWTSYSSGLNNTRQYNGIDVCDLNNDGLPDIAAGTYQDPNSAMHIFIQKNTGGWTENTSSLPSSAKSGNVDGVVMGDVNNDGYADIIYSTNGLKVLLGNGGGGTGGNFIWTTPTGTFPSSGTSGRFFQLQLADIDQDGDLDLLAPKSSTGLHLYLGNGSKNPGNNFGWTEVTGRGLPTTMNFYGGAFFDFDNDGDLDIAGATWGNGIKIYQSNLSSYLDHSSPSAVSDLTAENATTTSITVNWTFPADNYTDAKSGPIQGYYIRYSTTNIDMSNWASATNCTGLPTPGAPGTKQNYTINGLTPATQYYIALRSFDEGPNWSPLSNILINTTLGLADNVRPGQITDLQAINPTNNSINLTWSAPADNGSIVNSGSVIEYEIRYNTTQVDNSTWKTAKKLQNPPTPGSPGTTELLNITGFEAETTYYFAIKARDERPNWGWISNVAFNTTLPDPDITPPAMISDLIAKDPTISTINLTWTSVGDDDKNGTAVQYDIRYSTAYITPQSWSTATICPTPTIPKIAGSTEHYQVTGLDYNTTYYFAIKVRDDESFWSAVSNIAVNKTLPFTDTTNPGTINDLAIGNITENSIELTWTAPGDDDDDSGVITGYDIRYNTEPITEYLWSLSQSTVTTPTPLSPGSLQEYVVTGLVSNKKYYFGIIAYDERPNFSNLSNIVNATTLISTDIVPPSAVNDLEVVSTSTNTVTLSWTAPGDDGDLGLATGYDIRYATEMIDDSNWETIFKGETEPTPKNSGETESYTLTGLFSGTNYYFGLKSYDERPNYSLLSNIPSTTTYFSDDNTPPNKINDLKVVETTETTATLTWTASGDDGDSGTANAYEIRYASKTITDKNWAASTNVKQSITPKSSGKTEIYLITGLEKGTMYYFAIRAADERPNWSPVSNSPSGKTQGGVKSSLVVNIITEKTTLNSGETIELELKVLSKLEQMPVEQALVKFTYNPELIIEPSSGATDTNGTFECTIKVPIVNVMTLTTIYVDVSKLGFKENTSQITFTIKPRIIEKRNIDLHISSNNLTLSKRIISEGDKITISATFSNIGNLNASNVNVRFSINGIQLGAVEQVERLDTYKFITITKYWTAESGNQTIKIELIPSDSSLEQNDHDNSAEIMVSVLPLKEPDDGKEPAKEEDDNNIMVMILVLLPIIVIIIFVFIVFIVIMKKRKTKPSDHYEMESQTGTSQVEAPEAVTEETIEPSNLSPEMGDDASVSLDSEIVSDSTEQGEEIQVQEPLPPPALDDEPVPELIQSTEQLAESTAMSVMAEPEQGQLEQEPELEGSEPQENVQDQMLMQDQPEDPVLDDTQSTESSELTETQPELVACPTCQKQIALYTTPCPYCNSSLDWN